MYCLSTHIYGRFWRDGSSKIGTLNFIDIDQINATKSIFFYKNMLQKEILKDKSAL